MFIEIFEVGPSPSQTGTVIFVGPFDEFELTLFVEKWHQWLAKPRNGCYPHNKKLIRVDVPSQQKPIVKPHHFLGFTKDCKRARRLSQ